MLRYWLIDCQIPEQELWCISWLALDAKCEAQQHRDWDRWNHTRHLISVWTGQKPSAILPLPIDKSIKEAEKKKRATPDADYFARMLVEHEKRQELLK